MARQESAATGWCFTLNNPIEPSQEFEEWSEAEREAYARENDPKSWKDVRFCSWQLEEGKDGTPHYQGYAEFDSPKRLTALKKINARAHWEKRTSTPTKAIAYTQKKDTRVDGPWTIGVKGPGQGHRSDLDLVADEVAGGATMRQIARDHPSTYVQWGRGLTNLSTVLAEPYEHDTVRGEWFWGPPGTGKSHTARRDNPDLFLKSQSKWFDGYDGEPVILIDDLDKLGGDKLGHYLKIWADKYACTAEIKGATVNLRHRKIIITSNYSPEDLWDGEMLKAIERRFKVTHFDKLPTHDTTEPPKKKARTGSEPPMKGVYTAGYANLGAQHEACGSYPCFCKKCKPRPFGGGDWAYSNKTACNRYAHLML